MPTPKVWTERGERAGVTGWHDCTQSSALMTLIYAGYTNFPEGIYTSAEREVFESSDDRKDETGATLPDIELATQRRYGKAYHQLPDDYPNTLASFLGTEGYAFIIQGQWNDALVPRTHWLRRWQPSYTGGHAVCVVTLGGGKVLWLDPMATDQYSGDVTDVATVMKFAWKGRAYSRYLKRDELLETEPVTTLTVVPFSGQRVVRFAAGQTVNGWDPAKDKAVKSITPTKDTWAHADATVYVEQDPKRAPNGTMLRMTDGYFEGLLVFMREASSIDPEPPDERDAKIATLTGQVQTLTDRLAKKDLVFDSLGEAVAAKVKSGKAL